MRTLQQIRDELITPALAILPSAMGRMRPQVDVQLLSTNLQESPNQDQCQITANKNLCGPARGIWQFEKNGGVKGVLAHRSTKDAAVSAMKALGLNMDGNLEFQVAAVYEELRNKNDVVDAVFARLLYWSDALPLPKLGDAEGSHLCYLRNWRPGAWTNGNADERKKLHDKWLANYAEALEVVNGQ